jgi:hypothetical protein
MTNLISQMRLEVTRQFNLIFSYNAIEKKNSRPTNRPTTSN